VKQATPTKALDSLQLDGLREAATIGAGHAATALSQLTSRIVRINVPRVHVISTAELDLELSAQGSGYIAVTMGMLGDVAGQTVQIFPKLSARRLTALLLETDENGSTEELEQSTLCEVGNIIVGAYLDALSRMMSLLMFMSIPQISVDKIIPFSGYQPSDRIICFHTDLDLGEEHFAATFLFMPNEATVGAMLRSMQLA
jgi:chemotaxis protein CheC